MSAARDPNNVTETFVSRPINVAGEPGILHITLMSTRVSFTGDRGNEAMAELESVVVSRLVMTPGVARSLVHSIGEYLRAREASDAHPAGRA
jgi:hypothetical protein